MIPFKYHKYLYFRYLCYSFLYNVLLIAISVIILAISSTVICSLLIENGVAKDLDDALQYIINNISISVQRFGSVGTTILFVCILLWIYLIFLLYRKSLNKVFFKPYKRIIVHTTLKTMTWPKTLIVFISCRTPILILNYCLYFIGLKPIDTNKEININIIVLELLKYATVFIVEYCIIEFFTRLYTTVESKENNSDMKS